MYYENPISNGRMVETLLKNTEVCTITLTDAFHMKLLDQIHENYKITNIKNILKLIGCHVYNLHCFFYKFPKYLFTN